MIDNKYTDMQTEQESNKFARNESINEIYDHEEMLPEDSIEIEVVGDDEIELIQIVGQEPVDTFIGDPEFNDNLVTYLDEDRHDDLVMDILDKYEKDKEDRAKRDEQQKQALEIAGLDPSASPAGADFAGSSDVVHPALSNAAIDFSLRSAKELAPANGLVKSHIIGEATYKKVALAERKVGFLNYLMCNLMPYHNTLQSMLSQLPFGGSQFIKFWYDPYLKRPNCEFVPIDKVYIPYNCNDFYNADRVIIETNISTVEYWRRVKEGIYLDDELDENIEPDSFGLDINSNTSTVDDVETKSDRIRNKIEGKSTDSEGDDEEDIILLECYIFLQVEEDDDTKGEYAPYILTINKNEDKIVGFYRNWEYTDKKRQKLDYLVKFDFIPWVGAYGIGLGSLIGSLSTAATGALRALLDSALVNNAPTALCTKGLKATGQSPDIGIGSMTPIEGPAGLDEDIRKFIMPLPFNPPSNVLYQLLEFLTNQAKESVAIPSSITSNMGDRTPANTTLALIEQASAIQSTIHQNLHKNQLKCFEVVTRILRTNFEQDGYPEFLLEDYKVNAGLFDHTRDIQPVSDPNIFSEVQRYAQFEALLNLASKDPTQFNMVEIYKRGLQLLKIPQSELLLNTPMSVSRCNPVAENATVLMGNQVQVYPEQNHYEHIIVHLSFLESQMFGGNPAFNSNLVSFIDHLKEHLSYYYVQLYQTALKDESQMTGIDIFAEDDGEFDVALADVTESVMATLMDKFAPIMERAQAVLNNLMQLQSQQQEQQMNPDQVKLKIAQMQSQQEQAKLQLEQQISQLDMQNTQSQQQIEQARLQSQQQIEQQRVQIEQMKAQAELEISKLQLQAEQEESSSLVLIEQIRAEQQRYNNILKMEIELLKQEREMSFKSLETGHKLGIDVAKHQAQLNNSKKNVDNNE